MPRVARQIIGGVCYHVINRGNKRATVFHDEGDYFAFVRTIHHACRRVPMRVLGFCIMPNHYHLVMWPREGNHLSEWMRWLQTAHARRYHKLRGTSGHVWQGRYKSFPTQQNRALNTVIKYVENNPVRAEMVKRSEHWPWSSAGFWLRKGADKRLMRAFREEGEPTPTKPPAWVEEGPVSRPKPWLRYVNATVVEEELNDLRSSIVKELPFGSETWVEEICDRLGVSARLRPQGRPRKE